MDEFTDGLEVSQTGDLLSVTGSESDIFNFIRTTDAPGSSTFFGFSDGSGFGILDSLTKVATAAIGIVPGVLRSVRGQQQPQSVLNQNTLLWVLIAVGAFLVLKK
jgi:hypothetical protein